MMTTVKQKRSCSDPQRDMRPQELTSQGYTPRQICGTYPLSGETRDKLSVCKSKQRDNKALKTDL